MKSPKDSDLLILTIIPRYEQRMLVRIGTTIPPKVVKIDYSSTQTGTLKGADVVVDLTFNESSSKLTTKAEAFTAEGLRFPETVRTLSIEDVEKVKIDASGANGKPGLHGKDGAPGESGRSGLAANEHSAGTHGGPGYPGQDGTSGTSGGPGGDGGHVLIQVSENDTDLLGIVEVDNTGGSGGAAGRHGVGGPGGKGGRGGPSFEWTTQERVPVQVYKLVSELIYDPDGLYGYHSGDFVERRDWKTVTEYRTEDKRHCNPAGYDGPDGPPGKTPTAPLHDGEPGKNGTLQVLVTSDGGNWVFEGIYNLSLVSFKVEPTAQNGVFEPGATIEVSDIVIKNTGLMPTPAHKRIKIRIAAGAYIGKTLQELYLLSSVEPGQEMRIPGTMRFVIDESKGHQAAPYSVRERIDLSADLSRLNKRLTSFSNPRSIELAHPLELGAVEAPSSILPGEVAKISVVVRNRSSKDIGSKSLFAMCVRSIYASLKLSPEASHHSLGFCDPRGNRLATPRCEAEIPVVSAGGHVRISWYVSLNGAAEHRRTHQIHVALDIEKIGKSGELKRIEGRAIEISEGVGYQPKLSNDFLLVTNGTTTPTELNAWKSLALDLGLSFAVWDLSIYHHLFLSRPLASSSRSTLLTDWENKLIVVLNKQGKSTGQYPVMPFDRLTSADLDRALREHQAKVYVFGAPYPDDVRPSIAQPSGKVGCRFFDSVHELIRQHRDVPPEVGAESRVSIQRWVHPLSRDTDEVLVNAWESITRHFKEKFPRERITTYPEGEFAVVKEIPLIGVKKISFGHIIVKRERIAAEGDILSGRVTSAEMSTFSTITSFANKVLVFAAMPNKMLATKAVNELTHSTPGGRVATALARALFYNAARDLAILASEDGPVNKSGIPALSSLSTSFLSKIHRGSLPSEQAWGELMGTLSCLKAHYAPWAKRCIPWGKAREIAQKIDAHLKEMESHLLKVAGAGAMTRYREHSKRVRDAFWASRPTTDSDAITNWVLTEPAKPFAAPTIQPIRVNPYFVESDTLKRSYNSIETNMCGLVEKELAGRAVQVKRPA